MDQEKPSTTATTSTDSTTTTISTAGHGGNEAFAGRFSYPTYESSPRTTKVPSSKFKGVVPQPNGRWGAQIYEKHQRVWLGTFALEQEAARAYDVAAKRFRGREAAVNLKAAAAADDHEEGFLNRHSKMEVVDMLRKHTYYEELEQSRRRSFLGRSSFDSPASADKITNVKEVLFEKVVTPSDVGKLNRLVIPKQYAEKHFPLKADHGSGESYGSYLLNFEDVRGGKAWRFRYSYWNSSQSYVLTRGWSRFVKEKNLKAGDVVRFLRSGGGGCEAQLYIDCNTSNYGKEGDYCEVKKVIRLFGVDVRVGEKRYGGTEMEVLGNNYDKKTRIV